MLKIKKIILSIIPKKILLLLALKPLKLISEILDGRAKISYSQQGEDLEILRFFCRKWGGVYVDIGAYHPTIYSNTKIFYKMGWRGINIEPNTETFKLFQHYRKKDINLNIAIGKANHKLTYYSFNNAAVNTFDEKQADHWSKQKDFIIKEKVDIQVSPLSEILNKYLKKDTKIDFMSIDVEGMDLEVLKTNDWAFKPKMILIEDSNILNYKSYSDCEIFIYLQGFGYRLYNICGITLIFVLNE